MTFNVRPELSTVSEAKRFRRGRVAYLNCCGIANRDGAPGDHCLVDPWSRDLHRAVRHLAPGELRVLSTSERSLRRSQESSTSVCRGEHDQRRGDAPHGLQNVRGAQVLPL
jgi:hypothetical protein